MAVGAGDRIARVLRGKEVHLLMAGSMAVQTAFTDRAGRQLGEIERHGRLAARVHMLGTRPVAGLAALMRGPAAAVEQRTVVGTDFEALELVLVAGLARVGANILGFAGRRCSSARLLLCGRRRHYHPAQ